MIESVAALIIEPNSIYREGLLRVIASAGCVSCRSVAGIDELDQLDRTAAGAKILVLVDVAVVCDAPDERVREIRTRVPYAWIVVLYDEPSREHLLGSIRAGANGYLRKSIGCDAFIKSLDLVVLGEPVYPALVNVLSSETSEQGRNEREPALALSEREMAVLKCLVNGQSNKLIARSVGIADATVKVHVKAIFRKIRVSNRTQAAIWAREHGVAANRHEQSLSQP
jgi:two-component system nitrate/nitrite response regulator NarL